MFIYLCRSPYLKTMDNKFLPIAEMQTERLRQYFHSVNCEFFFSSKWTHAELCAKECAKKVDSNETYIYQSFKEFNGLKINDDKHIFDLSFFKDYKLIFEGVVNKLIGIKKSIIYRNKNSIAHRNDFAIFSHYSVIYPLLLFLKFCEIRSEILSSNLNPFIKFLKEDKNDEFKAFKNELLLFSASINQIHVDDLGRIKIIKCNDVSHYGQTSNDWKCPYCKKSLLRVHDKKLLKLLINLYWDNKIKGEVLDTYTGQIDFFYRCSDLICERGHKSERQYQGEFPVLSFSPIRVYNENKTFVNIFSTKFQIAYDYFLNEVKKNNNPESNKNLLEFLKFLKLIFIPDPILILIKLIDNHNKNTEYHSFSNNIKNKDFVKSLINKDLEYFEYYKFLDIDTDTKTILKNNYENLAFGVNLLKTVLVIDLIRNDTKDSHLYIYVFLPYDKVELEKIFKESNKDTDLKLIIKKYLNNIKLTGIKNFIDEKIPYDKMSEKKGVFSENERDTIKLFINEVAGDKKNEIEMKGMKTKDELTNPLNFLIDNFYLKIKNIHGYDNVWILMRIKGDLKDFNFFRYLLTNSRKESLRTDYNNRSREINIQLEFEDLVDQLKNYDLACKGVVGVTFNSFLPEFIISNWGDPRMSDYAKSNNKESSDSLQLIESFRALYPNSSDYIVIPIVFEDYYFGAVLIYLRNIRNVDKLFFNNENYLRKCVSLLSLVNGFSRDLERTIKDYFVCSLIKDIRPNQKIKKSDYFIKLFSFLPKVTINLKTKKKFIIKADPHKKYDYSTWKYLEHSLNSIYDQENIDDYFPYNELTLILSENTNKYFSLVLKHLKTTIISWDNINKDLVEFIKSLDEKKIGIIYNKHPNTVKKRFVEKFIENIEKGGLDINKKEIYKGMVSGIFNPFGKTSEGKYTLRVGKVLQKRIK